MMAPLSQLLGLGLAYCSVLCHAFPNALKSNSSDSIKVTYKEPGICETTPGVKSYSGYVTLPSTTRQPYAQKVFFWFFEARNSPEEAPLAIWLQGGPGAPSIDNAISENGPCIVQDDSNSTALNPLSWNNYVNLLYIDQPVQTGFSYDQATPGVMDMITGVITPGESTTPSNYTSRAGVFGSQDPAKTPVTTASAAEAIWEFTQAWMKEFKQYRRDKISVWSQSYGGHYAPAVANLLQTRSSLEKRLTNGISHTGCQREDGYLDISVDSVGIVNGFIDLLIQGEFFPKFAVNNTYDIQAYDQAVADSAIANLTRPGGCKEQVDACRALTPNGYRDQDGSDQAVLEACGAAFAFCWTNVYGAYDALSGRDWFDIAALQPVSFPPPYAYGYLQKDWVLKALGAEVNYTSHSTVVESGFFVSGDFAYSGFVDDLGSLLNDGVKVALIHGDRDFRCNWLGGEAVSLAVEYKDSSAFRGAGYEEISTSDDYIGGFVRQKGLFSFSRVFQAGHSVSNYQPETAYQIFMRSIFGQDVATGTISLAEKLGYQSQGPADVFNVKNEVLPQPGHFCYILGPGPLFCTLEQIAALQAGTAVVENDIVVDPPSTRP